jgi:hypothetical protein
MHTCEFLTVFSLTLNRNVLTKHAFKAEFVLGHKVSSFINIQLFEVLTREHGMFSTTIETAL